MTPAGGASVRRVERPAARQLRWPAARPRSSATVRWLALAGAAADAASLSQTWLQAELGPGLSAADLPLQLPGLGRPFGASWSAVVIGLAAAHLVVAAVPARHQAVAARTGVALSVAALGGFLLVGGFTDEALRQRLLDARDELDTVRRIVGYGIPRPSVTTLGPLELPPGAAAVVSALRVGFLLALLAGGLSVATWVLARRGAAEHRTSPGRAVWGPRAVVAALGAVVVLVAVQAGRASWLADRAAIALGEDRLVAARADAAAAVQLNDTLSARPALQQTMADVATATATGPPALQLYGRSLLALDAGHPDDALGLAVRAAEAAPGVEPYRDAVCRQATALAAGVGDVDTVRSLVPVSQRCDATLLQLAVSELDAGRYDLVGDDAGQLSRQTPDEDVRSAALTVLARARLAAGDLVGGRTLLQRAITADPNDVNVVARALGTGLYSGDRR